MFLFKSLIKNYMGVETFYTNFEISNLKLMIIQSYGQISFTKLFLNAGDAIKKANIIALLDNNVKLFLSFIMKRNDIFIHS